MSGTARQLLSRLIPPAREELAQLEAKRRQVVWGNTQVTLRVREYPKSKDERVSLVLPNFHRVQLYSEVLRRKVKLTMTNETLRMIEDMGGLDSYLLKTPDSRLKSDVASAVKWEVVAAMRRRQHAGASVAPGVQQAAAVAGAPQQVQG